LRCKELASLTARSFDFDADPPTVTIGASDEKSRRGAVLPLPRDVAGDLRQWLAGREDDSSGVIPMRRKGDDAGGSERLLWPGSWTNKAAKMLRQDLQDAGIPYEDEDGRKFDFHALRSQFGTDLARSNVPLSTAQKLLRHTAPRLTARHYTHLGVVDLDSAVQQLPQAVFIPMQATGTHGRENHGSNMDQKPAVRCDSVRPSETTDGEDDEEGNRMDYAANRMNHAVKEKRRRPDSNRRVTDLQSVLRLTQLRMLTVGYGIGPFVVTRMVTRFLRKSAPVTRLTAPANR
jgi:hypothetical protein